MTPEKPEAVNMGPGIGLPPVPDPICYRVIDKPCGCSRCEDLADYTSERLKEIQDGNDNEAR